ELRQLVQAGAPQEAADPRHAGVDAELEDGAVDLAEVAEVRLHPVGAVGHRAELVEAEAAAAEADALLDEDRGAGRVQLDRDDDGQPDREGRDQHQAGHAEVQKPLERRVVRVPRPPRQDDRDLAGVGMLYRLERELHWNTWPPSWLASGEIGRASW